MISAHARVSDGGNGGERPEGNKTATPNTYYSIPDCHSGFWESPSCLKFGSIWETSAGERVRAANDVCLGEGGPFV